MISETKQGTLDGRPVELREVNIGIALAANKAGEGDPFEVGLRVLVHSAYWAGSEERVFADRAAIDLWPMRMMREISELSNLASRLNLPRDAETQIVTNGSGEPRPSHLSPNA